MKKYYHAIVKLADGTAIKYHEVTNMVSFCEFVLTELPPVRIIFFYELPYRGAKDGIYCRYYTNKLGLQFPKPYKKR